MSEFNERLMEKVQKSFVQLYPEFPKNMLIEVTNKCNCKCLFCANEKMKRKRGFISPEIVEKVLNGAYQLGTREVGFYTTGESLLDYNLEKYILKAKKIGYQYIYLTTNGILLNQKRIESLVKAGLDSFKLSINGINRIDYEFIHGIDLFDLVYCNLKNLYEYRQINNFNYKIFVSYIATKYTDYNHEEIKKNFASYCDEVAIINVRNQGGYMPSINEALKCSSEENKIPGARQLPCYYPFKSLIVTYEGYLTACCTDFENQLVYADLKKESLEASWHNEKITFLRKQHLAKKILENMCYNCIYDKKCLGKALDSNLSENLDEDVFASENVLKRVKKYRDGGKSYGIS